MPKSWTCKLRESLINGIWLMHKLWCNRDGIIRKSINNRIENNETYGHWRITSNLFLHSYTLVETGEPLAILYKQRPQIKFVPMVKSLSTKSDKKGSIYKFSLRKLTLIISIHIRTLIFMNVVSRNKPSQNRFFKL